MAVYKPTYCYPYLEPVDLTIPDGEKYFTCQIDTSNIKITGYRVELYNENNEKIFPLNDDGKISPLSELNDTDGTLGLNGSELRFPFVQHWNSKIYPSYNAIYFKATNYVDYYQPESFTNTNMIISNGQLYYAKDGKPTSSPVAVDGSFVFVGDTLLVNQDFYTVTLQGLEANGTLTQSSIVYVKGGDSSAGKILQYTDGAFGESSNGAWCNVSGNSLKISNNGKTYKWQITLYSGERGATRTINEVNGAVEIDYSTMADNEFNTTLTSGTILGSTEDRIQGPISDKIYAKQWLQLLRKDENDEWIQVGVRTYIESYSQTLGCIYPISGDSRGFDNSDLYDTKTVIVNDEEKTIPPATHFAVYKHSNDPNSITSQNSVDESINFVLKDSGASYVDGSYSYEVTGSTQAEALTNINKFNAKCIGENSTPLCKISDDGTSGVYSGKSVLIWNKSATAGNPLTGYFTISFSLVKGSNDEKIPKFVFDMAYSYRKVSSYIGKVFFVKGGSFANENIVSKAEAAGENDVVSLGSPITFIQEEALEIYPEAEDKLHGEIFKNSVKDGVGTVYVSPFVGLQAGARLYVSDGTVIKAKTVDTTTWAVTYDAATPASEEAYSSVDPLKYEIRTNFKSSDETPFYAYDTPRLVPWSEQALSVVSTTGYEFLLDLSGQILTVPTVFSSEIHARYVHVTGQYLQAQNISWTSYRWLLVDRYGQVIQDTGKKYDGLIETTFYGLEGPTVSDVEDDKAVPTTYYPVLIVEDELGNSLIMGMEINVSLNLRNLPMEFSGGFDCKTQSVIMKIADYGYPKFSQDSNNKATVLDASKGVNYPIEAAAKPGDSSVSITGANGSLKAADQVVIPNEGAQLKHFFAKDTTEIPDLSNAPKKLATNNKGNIEFHTKVKLDANFCGEILKYTVDIGNALGSTDKLSILLELPSNFRTQEEHRGGTLRGDRNQVKCIVSTKDVSKSASGVKLFTSPTEEQEAYYLQPLSWINSSNGDLIYGDTDCEYLDFEFAIDAKGKEYNGSDEAHQPVLYNINEPINTIATRNIGECCLQIDGGNYFNKWTDLKRVQIETPVGPRVVQAQTAAVWNDTDTSSGKPMIWTEGWSETADTTMVQVKRHAEVATNTWLIDCYMRDIDELFDIASTLSVAFADNQWTVSTTDSNKQTKDYIFLMMNKEVVQ